MVTLVFSYYLISYLLIPAAIFRWFVSLFIALKNFQRTKTQEITFAVGTSLTPFFLAWALSWSGYVPHALPVNENWSARRSDYKAVYAGVVDEKASDSPAFWHAATLCGRRQADFLFFFCYPLVLVEAGLFAFLVKKYGDWKGNRSYQWVAGKFLLPHLSEWEMLLTPFNFPKAQHLEVWLDVLTSDNVLYRGVLGDRFLDSNGLLTGIILAHRPDDARKPFVPNEEHSPKRFDRDKYKRAAEAYPYSTRPQDYWRDIPSGAFYISSDKILNMNVSYVEKDPLATIREAIRELTKRGMKFDIEPLHDSDDPPENNVISRT
jgi:hypothetical protein